MAVFNGFVIDINTVTRDIMRNKNIEKNVLSRVGVLGSCEVKVTRSRETITFLFIYIHLRYAAVKRFPMILTSLKSNKK